MENYIHGLTELTPHTEDSTCYVLDTNYLLDSLSSVNYSEQYFKAIMENKSKIFIPFIVWVEFNYNIQEVLEKTEGLLEGSKNFLGSYETVNLDFFESEIITKFNNIFNRNIIEKNVVGQAISSDIKEYFSQKINLDPEFKDIISSLNEKNKNILKEWEKDFRNDLDKKMNGHIDNIKKLLINLKEEVNSSDSNIIIGKEYSKEELDQKIKECGSREKNNLYPGNSNEDLSKKGCKIWGDLEIPQKYGDMLLWLELIEFAKNNKEFNKFIIVSNDTEKEDWVLKKTKKLFPQLCIEFFTKTSGSTVEHMKSFDFVTAFSPETSQEDLEKDYIIQQEESLSGFDDIAINTDPVADLFADIELEDYAYKDTIVVPAKLNGFKEVFLGEDRWYSINISNDRIPYLKYIAAYQSQPVSAVTYVARIASIEKSPYNPAKKMVIFDGAAKQLRRPIPLGDDYAALQGPRYTNHTKLNSARTTDDLFNFDDIFDADDFIPSSWD